MTKNHIYAVFPKLFTTWLDHNHHPNYHGQSDTDSDGSLESQLSMSTPLVEYRTDFLVSIDLVHDISGLQSTPPTVHFIPQPH